MNEMKKEIKKEQEIENKIKKEHEMEREIERTVSDSRVETVHMVRPNHMNAAGRLFGGQLMQWLDEVAGLVRFSGPAPGLPGAASYPGTTSRSW